MSNIPTPHISAKLGDFAETVLMPGDPLRSKFIAENFLDDPVLVNNVRGVQGYTGTYKGKRVSVMASGMGMPAIGIYSHELFNFYDVKNIIRIGTAGGLMSEVKVKDIVMGMACVTNSNWAAQYEINASIPAVCSSDLKCTGPGRYAAHRHHLLFRRFLRQHERLRQMESHGCQSRRNGSGGPVYGSGKSGQKCPLHLHRF